MISMQVVELIQIGIKKTIQFSSKGFFIVNPHIHIQKTILSN